MRDYTMTMTMNNDTTTGEVQKARSNYLLTKYYICSTFRVQLRPLNTTQLRLVTFLRTKLRTRKSIAATVPSRYSKICKLAGRMTSEIIFLWSYVLFYMLCKSNVVHDTIIRCIIRTGQFKMYQ